VSGDRSITDAEGRGSTDRSPWGAPLADLQALEHDALTRSYARQPVSFVRGEGARLWDTEGVEYLDFQTGLAVTSCGHGHPAVVEAIRAQAERLVHTGNLFYSEPQLRLAERLAVSLGEGSRVHFANSGTEAVEAALKVARKAGRGGKLVSLHRGKIVSLHRGFHGRTYGALSATPQESKQAPFAPLVPGFVAVEPTAAAITAAVDDETAAVILEPVQGESGVYVLDDDVLRAARDACDRRGAALIFDEVQCGLSRTGRFWAWEHSGVRPDALTCAKALANGLPIGALVCGPKLADVLEPGDHGSTFAGGPVQCAAALAVLDVLGDPALQAGVLELGERLAEGLRELPGVVEVRGRGLMLAAELQPDHPEGAPAIVRRALLDHRIVLNATGPTTVRFLPPLTIGQAEADDALGRMGAALAG
jgi:predicted acetylornithine/succinylornithine family transaminase